MQCVAHWPACLPAGAASANVKPASEALSRTHRLSLPLPSPDAPPHHQAFGSPQLHAPPCSGLPAGAALASAKACQPHSLALDPGNLLRELLQVPLYALPHLVLALLQPPQLALLLSNAGQLLQ